VHRVLHTILERERDFFRHQHQGETRSGGGCALSITRHEADQMARDAVLGSKRVHRLRIPNETSRFVTWKEDIDR